MKKIKTPFKGLLVYKGKRYNDKRGFLREVFQKYIIKKNLVFSVTSSSKKNVLRGLHLQTKKSQDKYITVLKGKILDVVVDLRRKSKTYGKHFKIILDENNIKFLIIPKGFAHGFQTLEPNCEILYFHTQFYAPHSEGGYRYDSPQLNIPWPLEVTEVSRKDENLDFFCSMGSQKQNAM